MRVRVLILDRISARRLPGMNYLRTCRCLSGYGEAPATDDVSKVLNTKVSVLNSLESSGSRRHLLTFFFISVITHFPLLKSSTANCALSQILFIDRNNFQVDILA